MKKFKNTLGSKILALTMVALSILLLIGGSIAVIFFVSSDFYSGGYLQAEREALENITINYEYEVIHDYIPHVGKGNSTEQFFLEKFAPDKTNYYYRVSTEAGTVIATNFAEQDYRYAHQGTFRSQEGETLIIDSYVAKTFVTNDQYSLVLSLLQLGNNMKYIIYPIMVLIIVILIASLVYLFRSAGRRPDDDEIHLNFIDHIPFDLYILLSYFSLLLLIVFSERGYNFFVRLAVISFSFIGGYLVFMSIPLTFATRVKKGKWWKNTIIYRVVSFLWHIVASSVTTFSNVFTSSKLKISIPITYAVFALIELFISTVTSRYYSFSFIFFWWALKTILIAVVLIYICGSLDTLRDAAKTMANGNFSYKVDTQNLRWAFAEHGKNLNSIADGMKIAVNDQMKSERMKTELITNVSHDIKTPLTSIINYVDLLKRLEIEEEPIKDYISVLDRQSYRLKHLTDDLVEISKASSGSMNVSIERANMNVFINQFVGEYDERFSQQGLEVILSLSEDNVDLWADTRLLWRALDNLFLNIYKYAQPSSRVYIDTQIQDDNVMLTIRNISHYALNISSDELMERFTRGDAARTTEGSGLGLAIARSLIELQHGTFALNIDGDLFKVIMTLPRADAS